ncbi:Oidioi.mRNA.OKI2018_I69.chr2.g6370.t1.cds [Oikopleura dioica]|uniref:Oidioi.mRNA.OKI2018_I69.chr2.g6370.t1.cds n=1 Tax=Oikopleura dioica TaxID=34765 RepID=A0ABN7T7J9_OIKDI|nr:Oidioi.mRNA.OKI2018_I69.chr2.g6370.t1.cds [Oikopleura dioica]
MASLEESLIGRELINALDKSPEQGSIFVSGYQKSSYDYRPRVSSSFGESLISEDPENLDEFAFPELENESSNLTFPQSEPEAAVPVSENQSWADPDVNPWNELEKKCDEAMEEYAQLFRPHPMIISMKLEARIQLKFKELDLPDEGLPGKQLLERYIGQLSSQKTEEALRKIKNILDNSQKAAQQLVAAIKENLPPQSFLSEKINFSVCQTTFTASKLRQHRELFTENIQTFVPNFPRYKCADSPVFSIKTAFSDLTDLKIKISDEMAAIKAIIYHIESLITNPSSFLVLCRDRLKIHLSAFDKTTTDLGLILSASFHNKDAVEAIPGFNECVAELNQHAESLYTTFTNFVRLIIDQVSAEINALPVPISSANPSNCLYSSQNQFF